MKKKNNNKKAFGLMITGGILFISVFILAPIAMFTDAFDLLIGMIFIFPVIGMILIIAGFAVGAAGASKEYHERYKNESKTYKYDNYSSYEGYSGGYCENCGSKIESGVSFCGNCGAKVEKKAYSNEEPSKEENKKNDDSYNYDDIFNEKSGVCPSCGCKVESGDFFCSKCGKVL